MKYNRKRFFNRICGFFAGVFLSLFIISASVIFVLNLRPLYRLDMKLLNIPQYAQMSPEKVYDNYDTLIDYNSFLGPKELNLPDFSMSREGRIHFREVKNIFLLFEAVAIASFLLYAIFRLCDKSIAKTIYLKDHERILKNKESGRNATQEDGYHLLVCGLLSLILPSSLLLIIAIDWQWAFVTFHKITFNNDYWIFDESTDPVIKILPDSFFMHCAILIILIVMLSNVFNLWRYFRRSRSYKKVG